MTDAKHSKGVSKKSLSQTSKFVCFWRTVWKYLLDLLLLVILLVTLCYYKVRFPFYLQKCPILHGKVSPRSQNDSSEDWSALTRQHQTVLALLPAAHPLCKSPFHFIAKVYCWIEIWLQWRPEENSELKAPEMIRGLWLSILSCWN